jgi:hypothetical protein
MLEDGERMHGYLLAVDEALDWDVDEFAHGMPIVIWFSLLVFIVYLC